MARITHLVQVFNVQCVMCGRAAGQVLNGRFLPSLHGRAPVVGKNSTSRCGECGGNLYLEPDESVTPFMAAQIAEQRAAAMNLRAAA
jgi:hypothetical protein